MSPWLDLISQARGFSLGTRCTCMSGRVSQTRKVLHVSLAISSCMSPWSPLLGLLLTVEYMWSIMACLNLPACLEIEVLAGWNRDVYMACLDLPATTWIVIPGVQQVYGLSNVLHTPWLRSWFSGQEVPWLEQRCVYGLSLDQYYLQLLGQLYLEYSRYMACLDVCIWLVLICMACLIWNTMACLRSWFSGQEVPWLVLSCIGSIVISRGINQCPG